ncbi:alpha-1A adrenergic receptor-like [Oculina patagonica]
MENRSLWLNLTPGYSTSGPTVSIEGQTLELSDAFILCTVLGVTSALGTLGTSLVLLSIIKFESLREIPDLFIFSLSLSDFIVTAVYQPLEAYRLPRLQQLSVNTVYYQILHFLGIFSMVASITNMFGVTVERLIAIRFPLKYDIMVTRRRAIATVVCIWIFSATCGVIWSRGIVPKKYLGINIILFLTGTVSIYFHIFLIAKRVEDSVIQVQNGSLDEDVSNIKRKRKAAKTIAIILGVAVGCWLPFLIFPHVLSKDPDHARYWKIFFSLHVLAMGNSSINPYIYCARSRRYFVAFVKLLGLQGIFKVHGNVAPAAPVHVPRFPNTSER